MLATNQSKCLDIWWDLISYEFCWREKTKVDWLDKAKRNDLTVNKCEDDNDQTLTSRKTIIDFHKGEWIWDFQDPLSLNQ